MASAPHSPSALSPRQSMRKELVLALVLNSVVVGSGSPPPGAPMERQSQDFRRNPGHHVPHSDQCWKLHAGPWQLIPKAPSTHSNPLTPQEPEAAAQPRLPPALSSDHFILPPPCRPWGGLAQGFLNTQPLAAHTILCSALLPSLGRHMPGASQRKIITRAKACITPWRARHRGAQRVYPLTPQSAGILNSQECRPGLGRGGWVRGEEQGVGVGVREQGGRSLATGHIYCGELLESPTHTCLVQACTHLG